jgi:hypothetical protein
LLKQKVGSSRAWDCDAFSDFSKDGERTLIMRPHITIRILNYPSVSGVGVADIIVVGLDLGVFLRISLEV